MADTKAKTATEPAEAKTKSVQAKAWEIAIDANSGFCGTGAGGVQFANGKAKTDSARMAKWFKEHPGYTVTEV